MAARGFAPEAGRLALQHLEKSTELFMANLGLIHNPIEDDVTKPSPPTASEHDLFQNLAKLRLDQNFVETAGVRKLLTRYRWKAKSQDFVRVHPNSDYRGNFAVIELRDDREMYLLTPEVARELPNGLP